MSYTEIGRIEVGSVIDDEGEVFVEILHDYVNKAEAIGLIAHFTKVFELGEGESQEEESNMKKENKLRRVLWTGDVYNGQLSSTASPCNAYFHQFTTEDGHCVAVIELDDGHIRAVHVSEVKFLDRASPSLVVKDDIDEVLTKGQIDMVLNRGECVYGGAASS